MKIAMLGLGKMGGNMSARLIRNGISVVGYDNNPEVIKKLRPLTKKVFDVHLMIKPVDNFIKDFSNAGADIITFHDTASL